MAGIGQRSGNRRQRGATLPGPVGTDCARDFAIPHIPPKATSTAEVPQPVPPGRPPTSDGGGPPLDNQIDTNSTNPTDDTSLLA